MIKFKRKKEEDTLSVYADAVVNTTFALSKAEPEPLSEMAQFAKDIRTCTSDFNTFSKAKKDITLVVDSWEYFQEATKAFSENIKIDLQPYMYQKDNGDYIFGWTAHGVNQDAVELNSRQPRYQDKQYFAHFVAVCKVSGNAKRIELAGHFRGFMKESMNTHEFLYGVYDFVEAVKARQLYLEKYERA